MTQKRNGTNSHTTYRIKFRNKGQSKALQTFDDNTLTFLLGPAGTGKTFIAAALAVREAFEGRCENIILTRPLVESQEEIGWLPGDLKEKTDPFMDPIYEQYRKCADSCKEQLVGRMRCQPLAFTRGYTFEDATCVLDEAQNCTYGQLKLWLTRLGKDSKYIVTGDLSQIDIPDSGLAKVVDRVKNLSGVGVHYFTEDDTVRHDLVRDICRVL